MEEVPMKTAAIPAVRVSPGLRQVAEAVLKKFGRKHARAMGKICQKRRVQGGLRK